MRLRLNGKNAVMKKNSATGAKANGYLCVQVTVQSCYPQMKATALKIAILVTSIATFEVQLAGQEARYFSNHNPRPSGSRHYAWYGLPGGNSTQSKFHAGVDYLGLRGDPITSVGSGRVVSTFRAGLGDRGLGNTVIIQHASSSPLFSLYGHLDTIDPMVFVGRYVTKGQRLGTMGSTGSGSNNIVHLHFEFKTANTLASVPDVGVGYTTKHPDGYGYRNPANYFGVAQYGDFTLSSANPTQARVGAGLVAKPMIHHPFSQPSALDLRLEVLTTTGTPIRTLSTLTNQNFSMIGALGVTMSTSSHGLSAGTYRLRLQYKSASSTSWFVLPFGTASNPWSLTVTR